MNSRFKLFSGIVFLMLTVLLHGCNIVKVQSEPTYLPASVLRSDIKNGLSSYGNEQILEHSIFRPQFVDYLDAVNLENGSIDIVMLERAITTWNAVMTESNAWIEFNNMHFERLANVSGGDDYCVMINSCRITSADIAVVKSWSLVNSNELLRNIDYDSDYESINQPSIINSMDAGNAELNRTLKLIYNDPVGKKLIERCYQRGVLFRVENLEGKHGYYHHGKKMVVIDPKIFYNEFNTRYMIHEMVHAIHDESENSITEEVLAEIIGLDTQNRITGIPLELHPYSIFVQHVLHPEYGRLSMSNNIRASLDNIGLEL